MKNYELMVIGREMVRKINRQMKNYKLMVINKKKKCEHKYYTKK